MTGCLFWGWSEKQPSNPPAILQPYPSIMAQGTMCRQNSPEWPVFFVFKVRNSPKKKMVEQKNGGQYRQTWKMAYVLLASVGILVSVSILCWLLLPVRGSLNFPSCATYGGCLDVTQGKQENFKVYAPPSSLPRFFQLFWRIKNILCIFMKVPFPCYPFPKKMARGESWFRFETATLGVLLCWQRSILGGPLNSGWFMIGSLSWFIRTFIVQKGFPLTQKNFRNLNHTANDVILFNFVWRRIEWGKKIHLNLQRRRFSILSNFSIPFSIPFSVIFTQRIDETKPREDVSAEDARTCELFWQPHRSFNLAK